MIHNTTRPGNATKFFVQPTELNVRSLNYSPTVSSMWHVGFAVLIWIELPKISIKNNLAIEKQLDFFD